MSKEGSVLRLTAESQNADPNLFQGGAGICDLEVRQAALFGLATRVLRPAEQGLNVTKASSWSLRESSFINLLDLWCSGGSTSDPGGPSPRLPSAGPPAGYPPFWQCDICGNFKEHTVSAMFANAFSVALELAILHDRKQSFRSELRR